MSDPTGPVLLYDGVCGFCDLTVRWVLRLDRSAAFRFAPLDGVFAGSVLARYPELAGVDSLILFEPAGREAPEQVSVRSGAVIRTAGLLGGVWKPLVAFALIPRPLRDWAYDVLARHRYRLFGRFDACPLPPVDVRDRFLT